MLRNRLHSSGTGRESGFVLVTMAITTVAVLAVAGLAVDLGRVFIVKKSWSTDRPSDKLDFPLTRSDGGIGCSGRWGASWCRCMQGAPTSEGAGTARSRRYMLKVPSGAGLTLKQQAAPSW